jgi:hypothetical protein
MDPQPSYNTHLTIIRSLYSKPMAVHTVRTSVSCLMMHLGGLFNNTVTEKFAGNKCAHIIHVVSQLKYPTVYEKGCKCLLTSRTRVNRPTKLLPIITDTSHHYSMPYES